MVFTRSSSRNHTKSDVAGAGPTWDEFLKVDGMSQKLQECENQFEKASNKVFAELFAKLNDVAKKVATEDFPAEQLQKLIDRNYPKPPGFKDVKVEEIEAEEHDELIETAMYLSDASEGGEITMNTEPPGFEEVKAEELKAEEHDDHMDTAMLLDPDSTQDGEEVTMKPVSQDISELSGEEDPDETLIQNTTLHMDNLSMKEELNADTTIVTSTPIRACSTKIMVPVVRPEISPVEKPISSSTHCRNLLNLNPKMPVFTSMFGKMKQEPGVESSHVSNLRQKILNHRKRGKEVQKVPSSPPPKLPKTVVQPSKEEKPTAVIESKLKNSGSTSETSHKFPTTKDPKNRSSTSERKETSHGICENRGSTSEGDQADCCQNNGESGRTCSSKGSETGKSSNSQTGKARHVVQNDSNTRPQAEIGN
ncbi:ATF7IP_BD domain-containing protein [Caenorhabditis elegans]|uniref:ATF7IP_BD domain-containing protein n=1 Tax=Caenorhabditis elegans TaxID=6239 RepID=U4PFB3_CAEEL|nr:ATF7IP_BD domain-containing protein [Caenorhabditis elegans]CDH93432.1 ATF7IP_BD domain-containing protein [Caenorhabditis elegans]|eukprot:NP_001294625.1 Uncharacterized protein CELE_R08C7.5 [Caenorhabditis elegans]